jgi:hypothetical protein
LIKHPARKYMGTEAHSKDAILRTGDIVFMFAQPRESHGTGFRRLERFAMVAAPVSTFGANLRTAAVAFAPRTRHGDRLMPLILRAIADGVGSETHTAEYLPSGIPINSHHIIFLEAIAGSGEYPLTLLPRPLALGFPQRQWYTLSEAAFISAPEVSTPKRATGLKFDRPWLISGQPVTLQSRFGQLALGARPPGQSLTNLLTGTLDSDYNFVFRRYAPAFVSTPDGCRELDSTTVALTPLWCAENSQHCKLATGDVLFWHAESCQAYQEAHPDTES